MEENKIIIAKRGDSNKSFYGALSTLLLFIVFLALDIFFYIKEKATWALVVMIISATFVFLDLIGLWLSYSLISYSKKIKEIPLMIYDTENKSFIVMDCIFQKEITMEKDRIIEIKIGDKGETYLWYKKGEKKTSMFIGFASKGSEDLINNEIQKYKNLYE